MKKTITLTLTALGVLLLLLSCAKKDSGGEAAEGSAAETSYALGMFVGSQLKGFNLDFDYNEFLKGFKAYVEKQDTRFSLDDAMSKIQAAYTSGREKLQTENLEKEKAFLDENGKKPGVTSTPSGLQYEVITEGSGAKPGEEDQVKVHYEGTLLDGTVFDSSYERGEPVTFPLGGVIPGWTEGLQLMSEGSTYRFFIPAALAYGESGAGDSVPPNSTLIFKVELLEVVK